MKVAKKFTALILVITVLTGLVACNSKKGEDTNMVKIEMENGGEIEIELYPDKAPETVENFKNLVKDGFYDGLTFHRIVPGFVIQGGDPLGNGTGGSEKEIHGEFASNGFKQNDLKHEKGAVAMARSADPDSASSQFYITLEKQEGLDGDYAVFGMVTKGMDTVEDIVNEFISNYTQGKLVQPKIKTIKIMD